MFWATEKILLFYSKFYVLLSLIYSFTDQDLEEDKPDYDPSSKSKQEASATSHLNEPLNVICN
jgi:hypothetical protein